MSESKKNPLEDLFTSIKSYTDLQIDHIKLNMAESLAKIFSRIIFFFLIFILLGIVLGILAAALSSWIGTFVGSTILGLLITAGIFLLAVLVLYLCRDRFLINGPLKMFIRIFFEDKNNGQEN